MFLKRKEKNKIKNKQPFVLNYPKLKNIFSMKEFEHYVNTNIFILNKTLIIRNYKNEYSWSRQPWDSFDNVIPSKVLDVMLKEETTIITNANKASNNIIKFINECQCLVKLKIDCHMFYCSSEIKNKGLGRHCDENDNLMIQIYGETLFKVWEKDKCIIEKVLKPGDLCYVPRHVDHLFESKSKRLSLSFPMFFGTEFDINYNDYWIKL
jgi:ribosomal protein L16 Arg81 hydroxylase